MAKLQDLTATRQALQELARIVRSTRQTLAAIISRDGQDWLISSVGTISQSPAGNLADTLEHIEDVREGFLLSHRTEATVRMSELRDMVAHVLLDWQWLQTLNLSVAPSEDIDLLDQQLLFFNHALIALGALPRLPAEAITFPQRRPSYSDVTPPVEPGELLDRIEEIERIIYQAEVMPNKKLAREPFRRTYAFFEASSWLVDNHLRPLL